jgi:hypothetical protein
MTTTILRGVSQPLICGPPETGLRPRDENDGHQQIDQHRRQRRRRRGGNVFRQEAAQDFRKVGPAQRIDEAHHDGGDERAANRADAADDGNDEGENEDVLTHADLHGQNRRLHQAGQAGERGAEPEHQREQQLDVDAERANHLAVRGAGTDQHADPRAHHQHVEEDGDRETDHDDRQPVARILKSGQNLHRPVEP